MEGNMLIKNLTQAHESVFDYKMLQGISGRSDFFDIGYIDFLQHNNGGYFFNGALHLFGTAPQLDYCDISRVNKAFLEEYKGILDEKQFVAFGADIFGNLFVFTDNGIKLFFIESGETEYISHNFVSAMEKICSEAAYYTGFELIQNETLKQCLCSGYRLGPKFPFVLGGHYTPENLVMKPFWENIRFSAGIARQIKEVPGGTKIKFRGTPP